MSRCEQICGHLPDMEYLSCLARCHAAGLTAQVMGLAANHPTRSQIMRAGLVVTGALTALAITPPVAANLPAIGMALQSLPQVSTCLKIASAALA